MIIRLEFSAALDKYSVESIAGATLKMPVIKPAIRNIPAILV